MDAQDGSTDVAQVEASRRRESKVVTGARVRSIDYEAIIEDTVAGFVGSTPDQRRQIYAHARSVVLHRLWLLRLPEPTVELEKLALDLAIGKIERRWGAQDITEKFAAQKLAAEKAIPFNGPEPPIEPSATAIVSIAGTLLGRLASPIGIAVALPAIAATIFFSLDMHRNVAYRGFVGDVVERWLRNPGGERGVTVRADVSADRGSTRAAPFVAAPAAEPRAAATAMMPAACGRGSSTSERACARNVSGRGLAAETPKTENEPLWLESFTAFSYMTWGSGPAIALSGPALAAEDFVVGGATPYVAPAPGAALSADAAPQAAAPQAPRSPVTTLITARVAALLPSGQQARRNGEPDRALSDFGPSIRIDSKQQYDLEIADCTALIESYAHDPMLVEALAANYGNAGAANILARVYRQRASALARRSSVERAVADLTQAIPLSADRGYAALIDRSKLHEGLGRHDLAAADARAALKIRPGSEEARLALSRLSALSNPAPPKGL